MDCNLVMLDCSWVMSGYNLDLLASKMVKLDYRRVKWENIQVMLDCMKEM